MDYQQLRRLLNETGYAEKETNFLVEGFQFGFDLGYRGPKHIKKFSPNLKFVIGDRTELWNKVMKEVHLKRYAGPYETPPFEYFIQSPIGLVPKDGGTKTRLIFHLSYPKNSDESVNANTPDEICSVTYQRFEDAVRLCLNMGVGCKAGKSDMSSAFRHLGMKRKFWKYLVMKAQDPISGQWFYFVDKAMPFGSSISCAHFQRFSDAVSHIVATKTGLQNLNYLDDFFFVALIEFLCNHQIHTFLQVCDIIKFPVSLEKTVWATTLIAFLGLLIDTHEQKILIPIEKVTRALEIIRFIKTKKNRKITLRQLQQCTGFLNFLINAIPAGKVFNRRLYAKGAHLSNQNHHLYVDLEMKRDLSMWELFLNKPEAYARDFFDYADLITSEDISFYTDASSTLGCGGYCGQEWFIHEWETSTRKDKRISINYLELYALTVGVKLWINKFKNRRVLIYCDNMSVVHMVNNTTSKCPQCMVLLRIIVLECMIWNVKLSADHVRTADNKFADLLSRLKYKEFRCLARKQNIKFSRLNTELPSEMLPLSNLLVKVNKPKKKNPKLQTVSN